MSISSLQEATSLAKSRLAWLADRIVRILAIAIGYTLISLLLKFRLPALAPAYLQTLLITLITGVVSALILLPLARRLPYRMGTRLLALFLPLYWIAALGNLVEAYFYTTISRFALTIGIVIEAIPYLVAAWLIAWLFPPAQPVQTETGIWQTLRERPLLSWVWRIACAGILFALFLQLNGMLLHLGQYYTNSGLTRQLGTTTQPFAISQLEELGRGIIFALVLLPVITVMRGRSWRQLLILALYVALIDAAFESWLSVLPNTSWTLAFRLGEGTNLTLDAIVRGVFIALLLALPASTSVGQQKENNVALAESDQL
jgi:hypothetical protein